MFENNFSESCIVKAEVKRPVSPGGSEVSWRILGLEPGHLKLDLWKESNFV